MSNGEAMDGEKWSDGADNEQRDRRSRSPLDKSKGGNRNSRDSGRLNRNGRNSNRSRSPRRSRGRAPPCRRIYVANIAYDCKWTAVKDLFREQVGEVSYVELFEDEGGKFRGCGVVEFKDPASVQKAVDQMHRFEYRGRQLVVKEDLVENRDKTGKPIGRSSRGGGDMLPERGDRRGDYGPPRGGGGPPPPQFNTYGLSPQFLDALGIKGPLTCRVFVANLDYKVTPSKLEDVFQLAGRVVKIDLKRDDSGNSKGHGTIEMGHPVEAVQAISMFNGQKFYNRAMSVRMDKKMIDDSDEKRLPEGLQGVGKGLGANGLPLHLSNTSSNLSSMGSAGISSGGGLGGGASMGLMSSQMGMGGSSTGIPGLSGIGLGLQERNFSHLTGGVVGPTSGSSLAGLGLGTTGTGSLGSSLLSGGLSSLSGTSGLTSSLSGLGSLGSLGGSSSTAGIGGYSDFDQRFDRLEDPYRSSRGSDTIIIRNLPAPCTWENVRDRFREYGDILSTQMKGRGVAVVRFGNERDAQRALDCVRNTRCFGRALDASFY